MFGAPRVTELAMRKLLAILVVLTIACGVAAGITIALAPAYAGSSADGY
jgi:hypothetical protein